MHEKSLNLRTKASLARYLIHLANFSLRGLPFEINLRWGKLSDGFPYSLPLRTEDGSRSGGSPPKRLRASRLAVGWTSL